MDKQAVHFCDRETKRTDSISILFEINWITLTYKSLCSMKEMEILRICGISKD